MIKLHIHSSPNRPVPGETYEFIIDEDCIYCKQEAIRLGLRDMVEIQFDANVYCTKTKGTEIRRLKHMAVTELDYISCLNQEYYTDGELMLWFWTGYEMGGAIGDINFNCINCHHHESIHLYYPGCPQFDEGRTQLLEKAEEHVRNHKRNER